MTFADIDALWAERAKSDPPPGGAGVDEDGIEFVWSEPRSIGLGFRPKPCRLYYGESMAKRIDIDVERLRKPRPGY